MHEQEREEVLDQEIEMDLAIQEHLFPKGGEVSHSRHCTVSGPSGQGYVTSFPNVTSVVWSTVAFCATAHMITNKCV